MDVLGRQDNAERDCFTRQARPRCGASRVRVLAMDVCLQTGSQSTAGRLVHYFQQHSELGVFPSPGFALQAEELGPHSDSEGPCVALFRGVGVDPVTFNTWLVSSIFHLHVRRVYWLNPGIPACATLLDLAAAVTSSLLSPSSPSPPGPLRLQCHPRSLELQLAPLLLQASASYPHPLDLNPRHFSSVVMVLSTQDQGFRWTVLPADQLYKMRDDEVPRFKGSVASAVNKLHEALILVRGPSATPPQDLGVAMDLGAAPGAWTSYLADHARAVVAVDPALLDPSALRPNVHHLRMRAEEAGPHFQEIMQQLTTLPAAAAGAEQEAGSRSPGLEEEAGPQAPMLADLLVCDMNLHPAETTQVLKSLMPLLHPGGALIYTLKFTGIARDRSKSLLKLHYEFREHLHEGRLIWLMANTVNERCYIAKRKD